MCRFLMVQSEEKIDPKKYLQLFADMCESSVSPYGGRQQHGWGVAWLDENNKWKELKSLNPMWEDPEKFALVPKTTTIVVHTRRASDAIGIGEIVYNEPFFNGDYCFVFNGRVNGVSLKKPVPGTVGAQKIWFLLQEKLKTMSPEKALAELKTLMEENSSEIIALNTGIATKDSLTALCEYDQYKDYFALRTKIGNVNIISSGDLKGLDFLQMKNKEIVVLDKAKTVQKI